MPGEWAARGLQRKRTRNCLLWARRLGSRTEFKCRSPHSSAWLVKVCGKLAFERLYRQVTSNSSEKAAGSGAVDESMIVRDR